MSYIPQSGAWDTIKKIGSSAIDIYGEQKATEARAKQAEELLKAQAGKAAGAAGGGTPKWLLPVGIGAAALVLILVLKK